MHIRLRRDARKIQTRYRFPVRLGNLSKSEGTPIFTILSHLRLFCKTPIEILARSSIHAIAFARRFRRFCAGSSLRFLIAGTAAAAPKRAGGSSRPGRCREEHTSRIASKDAERGAASLPWDAARSTPRALTANASWAISLESPVWPCRGTLAVKIPSSATCSDPDVPFRTLSAGCLPAAPGRAPKPRAYWPRMPQRRQHDYEELARRTGR